MAPREAPDKYKRWFGHLLSPRTLGIPKTLPSGVVWALDNDCYNGGLDYDAWTNKLELYLPFKDTCLFVNLPDVLGKSEETINNFHKFKHLVREYPKSIVSQDGMKTTDIPWDEIDAVFIGGSNEHKLGEEAELILSEAKRRNKWRHVGRVNTRKRIMKFSDVDSVDGTKPIYKPKEIFPLIVGWLIEIEKTKGRKLCLF